MRVAVPPMFEAKISVSRNGTQGTSSFLQIAGTAQKLVLNMVSTSIMIKLGRVRGNKMVDMQLSNEKLVDRGARMIMDETGLGDYDRAKSLLLEHGSVRAAVDAYRGD